MRRALVATVIVSAAFALEGCPTNLQACNATNCPAGCCDIKGLCQSGAIDTACGERGGICGDCSVQGRVCVAAQCRPRYTGGDDGGTQDSGPTGDGGCTGACSAPAVRCRGTSGYETCANFGGSCWDWVFRRCTGASLCTNGVCLNPDGGCPDECTGTTQKQCVTASSEMQCRFDSVAGCYRWDTATSCPPNSTCPTPPNTGCVPLGTDGGCTNPCSISGQLRCTGATSREECVLLDGCQQWRETQSCTSPQTCSSGQCVGGCTNQCVSGQRQCVGGNTYKTCQFSAGCWVWGQTTTCPPPQTCTGGNCADGACVSDCSQLWASNCSSTTSYDAIDICMRGDDAGCLRRQTYACGDDYDCVSGKCIYKATVPIGAACTSHAECNAIFTDAGIRAGCLTSYPGGYCVQLCIDSPPYAGSWWPCSRGKCIYLGDDSNGDPITYCMEGCNTPRAGAGTCRPTGDYVCERDSTRDGGGFCLPNCNWSGFDAGFCSNACSPQGYCQ